MKRDVEEQKINTQEEILIKAILDDNEEALLELFRLYRPMIEHSKRTFYVRDFDAQDWDQEALIVCHEAVKSYDNNKGKFSTFFKRQLKNKAISLVRRSNAMRRIGHETAMSLEKLQETESILLKEKAEKAHMVAVLDLTSEDGFINNLSKLEFAAFNILIGKYTSEWVINNLNINSEKLKRAKARVYKKFVNALLK